jgi:hypothetical protein
MVKEADRITHHIAANPGIRAPELADALDLDQNLINPILKRRIDEGQIVVGEVRGLNKLMVATYTINSHWKAPAEDAAAESARDVLPVRQTSVPAVQALANDSAAIAAPRQKRAYVRRAKPDAAAAVKDAAPAKRPRKTRAAPATPPVVVPAAPPVVVAMPAPQSAPADDQFVCATYHDGRGEIRTAEGRLVLSQSQVELVGRHFARGTPATV